MQRSTLTSRFLAGFAPGPLPPRGPDGMIPGPPPTRLPLIDPPSLCEAGPCRNYHRVVSVFDAQDPVGGTGPTRRQITRACYPTTGIELELGETPVLQCSRWEPETAATSSERDRARADFMKGPAGKEFAAEVVAFEAAQEAAEDEDAPEDEEDPEFNPPHSSDALVDAANGEVSL